MNDMKTRITTSAYTELLRTVGSTPAEAGGLLFGSRKDWVVSKFLFDKDAETTRSTYSFNVGYLNPMIDKLSEEGLQLLGFLHSHPTYCKDLSGPDREYFQRQFKNIPVDKFLTPLMFPATDGTYDFIPYVYHKDGRIEKTELDIMPDDFANYLVSDIKVQAPELVLHEMKEGFTFQKYFMILVSVFITGVALFILGSLAKIFKHLECILNL